MVNQASQFCQKKRTCKFIPMISEIYILQISKKSLPSVEAKFSSHPPKPVSKGFHKTAAKGRSKVATPQILPARRWLMRLGCLENFQIWEGRFSRWWWKNPTHLKNMRKSDLFHHFLQGSEWKHHCSFSKSKERQPWSKLLSSWTV